MLSGRCPVQGRLRRHSQAHGATEAQTHPQDRVSRAGEDGEVRCRTEVAGAQVDDERASAQTGTKDELTKDGMTDGLNLDLNLNFNLRFARLAFILVSC